MHCDDLDMQLGREQSNSLLPLALEGLGAEPVFVAFDEAGLVGVVVELLDVRGVSEWWL